MTRARVGTRLLVLAGTLSVLWIAAQTAHAATLTTAQPCWVTVGVEPIFPIAGTGFPPLTRIDVQFQPAPFLSGFVEPTSDANGGFLVQIPVSQGLETFQPVTRTLVATVAGEMTPLAQLPVQLVTRGYTSPFFESVVVLHARRRVSYRFAGFGGKTIYAHFLKSRSYDPFAPFRYVRTNRVGRSGGACGTLVAKRRPLGNIHAVFPGRWMAQYDTHQHYRIPTAAEVMNGTSVQECVASYRALGHVSDKRGVLTGTPCP